MVPYKNQNIRKAGQMGTGSTQPSVVLLEPVEVSLTLLFSIECL